MSEQNFSNEMDVFKFYLNEKVTILKINDESIELSNGMEIASHHDQDCCEHVYADFSLIELSDKKDIEFSEILIKKVDGLGFLFNGILINCYNSQNGYYSSDLELICIKDGKKVFAMDISRCCEDQED